MRSQIDLSQPDNHTRYYGEVDVNNIMNRIIKENLFIDSKTYNDLSPSMKDNVKDVFKFVEEINNNIVEKFDETIKTVI